MGLIRDAVTAVTLSILLSHSSTSNAFVSQTPVKVWGISKPTARTTTFPTTTTSRCTSVLQDRLSGEDIQARLQQQLAKLKEKDLASRSLTKEVRFSFQFRRDQNPVSVRRNSLFTRCFSSYPLMLLLSTHPSGMNLTSNK
jgi:hypothetical protein